MAKYLSNIDLNKNQLQNAVIHPLGTAPGTPSEGQIYYDSTPGDKKIYLYNGSAWVALSIGDHTTDYITGVSLVGTDLTFTSVGNAFSGTVDLSSLDELVNDSTITISAGTYLSTGGSFTLNQASNETITLNHDTTSRTDTTSSDTPGSGGSFEAVASVTTNATGHVTAIDVATINLPASDNYGSWILDADGNGATATITSGATADFVGGLKITTDSTALGVLNIVHDLQAQTDTTSAASPGYGGAFTVIDSVTRDTTGHATGLNVKTITLPASDNTDNYVDSISFNTGNGILTLGRTGALPDLTEDLDGRYGLINGQTVTLTGDVTGSGTTSIATTIATGAVDFNMINTAVIVTEAEGIENNDNDTTIPTSAAVKAYADSLIVGGLVYQGGYNAATNTPDLDSTPSASIKKGWTYTVTADGLFFTEQVRIGDVIIAEVDSPTTLADWTTVQNNVDLADLTTVGIGNVNAGTGIDVSYASGTATVSLTATPVRSGSIAVPNSATYTYPNGINSLAGTNSVLIQLVDSNGETVYADVQRVSPTTFSVNYGVATPTGVIALIQLIG